MTEDDSVASANSALPPRVEVDVTVEQLLATLDRLDVRITVEDGRLKLNAPKGALTAELRDAVRAHADVLVELRRNATPGRKDGTGPRAGGIPRRPNPDQPAPVSIAQRRLWALDRLEPGTAAYNIPIAARLPGVLDAAALEASMAEIIRRHETLRTHFVSTGDEPLQVVAKAGSFTLPVSDLSKLSPSERESERDRVIKEESWTPFDLENGPLFRVRLLILSPDDQIFLLTMHHIISDAWSVRVLFNELRVLYDAHRAGRASPLPELPIQYADFACWQQEWLRGGAMQSHLAYWKRQLSGELPVLDLPTDRPRPPIRTSRGGYRAVAVDPALQQRIARFCREEGVTTFMTHFATLAVLLHRYAGQPEVLIGSPFAGRTRTETEPLIGFFINTVVLRADLSGNPSFRQLAQRLRQVALEAHAHQDAPFDKIVEEVKPTADPSRNPLFQVFLNLIGSSVSTTEMLDPTPDPAPGTDMEAKFDFTLYVTERPSGLGLALLYNADLFDAERMTEMLAQYQGLLDQSLSAPDTTVDRLSLVTGRARSLLPDPTTPLPITWSGSIPERVERFARQSPSHPALEGPEGVWSYQLLDRISNRLGNHLVATGIGRGDVVAVLGARSPSLVWALLGIQKAGAAFTILDPAYPASRLQETLGVARAKGLIALEAAGPIPPEVQTFFSDPNRLVTLPSAPAQASTFLEERSNDAPAIEIDPDGLAYLAFTSGTTGKPKGIKGTHRPISHFLDWYQRTGKLSAADRFTLLSGLAHDPLLRDVFAPLWVGGTLCVPDSTVLERPGELLGWMKSARATVAHLTPPMVEILAPSGGAERAEAIDAEALPSLRLACFGGDRLTRQVLGRFQRLAPSTSCFNFYGATETPQAMGFLEVPAVSGASAGSAVVPIGRGIADVQLLILNAGGALAGVGELGEIHVRTPYLSAGYLDDEALTRERFVANPFTSDPADRLYRTGDLGRYRPDGTVEFLGRKDRQVKVRGFRIELGDIESALASMPGVRESVVIVREDESGRERLVAYLASDGAITHQAVRQHLTSLVPAFMIPAATVAMDQLPRTPNGKLDLRALPAPASHSAPNQLDPFLQPRDPIELELCRLWKETLGVDVVHPHDNFFDLGGHSLAAVRLFQAVELRFGKRLSLTTLFSAPTVEQLADFLRQEGRRVPASSLVPIEVRGSSPAFFCVHGIGGNVLNYYELASELGRDQPFYALQSIGVDGQTPPLTRIEEMVELYVREIRSIQPRGPYFLGGGCMGGVVAFAMAERLQSQGETVALLAFLDVPAPIPLDWKSKAGRFLSRSPSTLHLVRIAGRLHAWWRRPLGGRLRRLVHRTRSIKETEGIRGVLVEHQHEVTSIRVQAANYWAMRSYRLGFFRGRIVHFFSERGRGKANRDRRLEWSDHATGGQEIVQLSGEDSGTMLVRPHVVRLAEELSEALERARAAGETQQEPDEADAAVS